MKGFPAPLPSPGRLLRSPLLSPVTCFDLPSPSPPSPSTGSIASLSSGSTDSVSSASPPLAAADLATAPHPRLRFTGIVLSLALCPDLIRFSPPDLSTSPPDLSPSPSIPDLSQPYGMVTWHIRLERKGEGQVAPLVATRLSSRVFVSKIKEGVALFSEFFLDVTRFISRSIP